MSARLGAPKPPEHMLPGAILATFADGEGHGWETEFSWLEEHHPDRLRELSDSISREGMREPILLGNDGRVWDGHHRLYCALSLGLPHVPVERAQ